MTIQDILDEVRELAPEQRKELLRELEQIVTYEPSVEHRKKHTLMELVGLGAELWEGIDAQDYINQLRDEWDHRP